MTRCVKQLNELGELDKIGHGGQGTVYRVPRVKTNFADSMVYKEYKSQVYGDVNFDALAAMPSLVETALSYPDAERLIAMAAWPCEIVEDGGRPTGYLMPEIPEEFTISLTTVKGVSRNLSEFQHLLNSQSILDARGISIDDEQRYALLREVASGLAFFHDNDVCVGDLSPKNLLFTLEPRQAIYFIDCDSMRIGGESVLPQAETLGWEVPSGEDLATIHSDTYKLGLLALRLISGSQIANSTSDLPASTPTMLRQVISDTLNNPPEKRPLPATWTYVLGHAIEEAQHRKKTGPAIPAVKETIYSPEESDSISRESLASPATSAWSQLQQESLDSSAEWSSTGKVLGFITAGVVGLGVLLSVIIFVADNNNSSSSIASSRTQTTYYSSPTSSAQQTYVSPDGPAGNDPGYIPQNNPPPIRAAMPSLVRGPDSSSGRVDCGGGYHLDDRTGWATAAGRGTSSTSCELTNNVLVSYWDTYGNASREPRTVYAAGSVACNTVSTNCRGADFVMDCAAYAGEDWITCHGGRDAVVYLYAR